MSRHTGSTKIFDEMKLDSYFAIASAWDPADLGCFPAPPGALIEDATTMHQIQARLPKGHDKFTPKNLLEKPSRYGYTHDMALVIEQEGFRVMVRTRHEHNPPHVHVLKAGGECRVKIAESPAVL